jgi:glycosyltransferase involved in cell wall biosynthesis
VGHAPLTVLAINWHSGISAALYSGGGRRARAIIGGLARRGHQIHVVDVAPSVTDGLSEIASTRTMRAWLRPRLAEASPAEKAAALAYGSVRLSFLARRAARRVHPDVVYVPAAELLPALLAGLRASRTGTTPVPLAACATTIVRWTPHGADVMLHIVRRLLRRATATIVLGPAVAQKLAANGFPGRIVVGLTGVDRSPLLTTAETDKRLFFLSRVVPEKGVADALRAFASVPTRNGAVLEIRGSGTTRDWRRVEALASELGLRDSLRLGGAIKTDSEKWNLLADSWAFIAPSYMEHFGIAVREALSAGLPAVVYDLPPFDDLRGHPGLFAVPLGDVAALSQAVQRVLQLTPEDRSALTTAGRERSVGPTWDQAVEHEEQLLFEIASTRSYQQ